MSTEMTPARSRLLGFCMHNRFPFMDEEATGEIAKRLKVTRPQLFTSFTEKFSYGAIEQRDLLGIRQARTH